ncbi:hypothetical protein VTK73DRAFT_2835 [Phialemonium thermophilum]|uniref:Uncharacterized protein n=1 Tax=Phialemonium thermophilum TaxID=223376 RepID=A0ABR3VNT3_9PEZI
MLEDHLGRHHDVLLFELFRRSHPSLNLPVGVSIQWHEAQQRQSAAFPNLIPLYRYIHASLNLYQTTEPISTPSQQSSPLLPLPLGGLDLLGTTARPGGFGDVPGTTLLVVPGLFQELKSLGRIRRAGGAFPRLGVFLLVVGVCQGLVLFCFFLVCRVRTAIGEQAAYGRPVGPDRQADEGGVLDCRARDLVRL